jgi:hypothetical protein
MDDALLLMVTACVIDADTVEDAHLWTRQVQAAGGEVLGVEKHDDESYTLRALVASQAGLAQVSRR